MNPTLEQIKTDESVWPDGATHCIEYQGFKKFVDNKEYTLKDGAWIEEHDPFYSYCFLYCEVIPRPTKDWLRVDGKVITPKGMALVNKITEDDGVFTTLGNYCRSELSPVETFVPKIGEWCEYARHSGFGKIYYIGLDSSGFMVFNDTNGELLRFEQSSEFRPIKTERDVLLDIIKTTGNMSSGVLADNILNAGFIKET